MGYDTTVLLFAGIAGEVSSKILCRCVCSYLYGFREKWIEVNKVSSCESLGFLQSL